MKCNLCSGTIIRKYYLDGVQEYYQCSNCKWVFVPEHFQLSKYEEKRRYELHENDPNDPRYREFLSSLFNPLKSRLKVNSKGLDFGSGPGPTLSIMFEEIGFDMDIYDPYFAENIFVFSKKYDFITLTEVAEHLTNPHREFSRLISMLNESGFLGIMTNELDEKSDFGSWYYRKDPTHISFFSRDTYDWIAENWALKIVYKARNVVIFQRRILSL